MCRSQQTVTEANSSITIRTSGAPSNNYLLCSQFQNYGCCMSRSQTTRQIVHLIIAMTSLDYFIRKPKCYLVFILAVLSVFSFFFVQHRTCTTVYF
jgi:hypothetical protein